MAAGCEFPPDLVVKPLGYVALTGLDTVHNAVHRAIWDAFTVNRRQERVLNIQIIPADYDFPKRKQKRTMYEFYVPKGILKKRWMKKYLSVVPAVMVVFFDLDWDDTQWKERETACASRVAVLRASLKDRNTRLCVVLIQKNMPLPPGEDIQAAERASSLCTACELSAKSLFVLPFSDHLHGYITRLENAFYEVAQSYYFNESRRVKAHKENLNKSQHQLLFVRHQFKIAFFNELKQDQHAALKHYRQAYLHILEIKLTDVNNLEVKIVGGFLNYKICKLCFQVGAPLEAISQFRKHIDYFKNKDGARDLAFEHSAWMAKQFSLFGDLFFEAIKGGLQAIQTQHPGFYYQQAANHSVVRRQLCFGLCRYSEPVTPDPLARANTLEYHGQRPWRPGCQANEAPDPAMEQAGVLSLQAQELSVDHSANIIPLLSSAVAQFREYKSVRMKLYLMVQMGEEYYHAKDFNKALTLLSRVMMYYRGERWWKLFTNILVTGLRCAYLTASLTDYISVSSELCSSYSLLSKEEKGRIQLNMLKVTQGESPDVEHGCEMNAVASAQELWKTTIATRKDAISVETENLACFVECKAVFDQESFHADEVVNLKVFMRTTGIFPVRFSQLSVVFANQAYNQIFTPTEGDGEDPLLLEPAIVKVQQFTFTPLPADVNRRIEIKHVSLHFNDNTVFIWNGGGSEALSSVSADIPLSRPPADFVYNKDGSINWERVHVQPVVDVVRREPLVELEVRHSPPSLLDEYYKLTLALTNKETKEITDVKGVIQFVEESEDHIQSAQLYLDKPGNLQESKVTVEFSLGTLQVDETVERLFFVRATEIGEKVVNAKIMYVIAAPVGDKETAIECHCVKEATASISSVLALEIKPRVKDLVFELVEKVYAKEPFALHCNLHCLSPWPIRITETCLQLSDDFQLTDTSFNSQLAEVELSEQDEACECHTLVSPIDNSKTAQMGKYIIKWKRISTADEEEVTVQVPLPMIPVQAIPFSVVTDLPAFGCAGESLPVTYKIFNKTNDVQEMEVAMEPSDSFMFSGNSQIQFRVLPGDYEKITYSVFPLCPGKIPLPKLHLSLPRFHASEMDHLARKMIPTHVVVKPSEYRESSIEPIR